MYCPDTLKRLNDKAVEDHMAQAKECDYCDQRATDYLEIFNPADELRDPPVDGVYMVMDRCQDCADQGVGEDDIFHCDGCGRYFVRNHSWDVLSVTIDGDELCQKCASESIEPISLDKLYFALVNGNMGVWTRINNIPGKKLLWEGEYSDYSDFPGHSSLESVLKSIQEKLGEYGRRTHVYPIIDHVYQFSVSLAIYR